MPAHLLLLSLLAGPPAHANGQTTHIWITREARGRLPPGALRDLLQQPELEPMLVHGTMFPDGGYPLGHPYGEAAHWEPFQARYLDWIKSEFPLPYGTDAAPHIAFLMGLGSHGLADQTFDAFYLNRSQLYDADLGWARGRSMDEATDFQWAALTGPQELPDRWVPSDVLVPLFADAGIEVDAATLSSGQSLLELAVSAVGASAVAGGDLSHYEADFPWAMSNLQNASVPGIPDEEAEIVASYWEELWDRLHERSGHVLIDRTWPEDGSLGLTTAAESPDARISILFREGLLEADLTPAQFVVVDENGRRQEVDIWLYYGDQSHIVHLLPVDDWPQNSDLTVTVAAGLTTRTGAVLSEDHSFTVSTRPPPTDSGAPSASVAADDSGSGAARPKARCGCLTSTTPATSLVWLALFGLALARRRSANQDEPT